VRFHRCTEAANRILDWVCFGGPVVKSGDPVEQEKQLKYASLVANAVMLSNVADLTEVIADMAADGHPVSPELVSSTSPYMREQIRQFGRFTLDMEERKHVDRSVKGSRLSRPRRAGSSGAFDCSSKI
jgi:hypothetical protein